MAAKNQINISNLPDQIKSSLIQIGFMDIVNESNPELSNFILPILPKEYLGFIRVIKADFVELMKTLPEIKASSLWGTFIFRKLLLFCGMCRLYFFMFPDRLLSPSFPRPRLIYGVNITVIQLFQL